MNCGPCNKCKRRAETMRSALMGADGHWRHSCTGEGGEPRMEGCREVQTHSSGLASPFPGVPLLHPQNRIWPQRRGGSGQTGRHQGTRRMGGSRQKLGDTSKTASDRNQPRDCRGSNTDQARGSSKSSNSKERSWALPYSMQDLQQKQENDPDIAPVLQWLKNGS